jgi:putative chitinase
MSTAAAPLLLKICPQATAPIVSALTEHDDVYIKRGMTDATELCQFVAQVAVESWHMTSWEENLHYTGPRLWAVFGHAHFEGLDEACDVAALGPQAIANRIYGGRMGNVQPGDGYLFRGRGLLDLTGRDTYTRIGAVTGLDLIGHPELANDPDHALEVACGFWSWKGIGPFARANNTAEVTRRVQGSESDLAARQQYLARVKAILMPAKTGWSNQR